MRSKLGMAAIIISAGLGLAGTVSAQDLAVATPGPKSEFVVFANKDGRTLSPTALQTLGMAADQARSGDPVTLVGPIEETAAVKAELMRRGVADHAIAMRPAERAPIAKTHDGLSDPLDRRVEIRL